MTKRMPEIIHGLFCESARAEASGQITLIGIWGDSCKITVPPPTLIPSLSFHVFVRNPDCVPYTIEIRFDVPGAPAAQVVAFPVAGQPDQTNQNFNINMGAVKLDALGDVVATVTVALTPPAKTVLAREFRMAILLA